MILYFKCFDFIQFADDTTFFHSHENIESQMDVVSAELKKIYNWLKTSNQLMPAIHSNKTIIQYKVRFIWHLLNIARFEYHSTRYIS